MKLFIIYLTSTIFLPLLIWAVSATIEDAIYRTNLLIIADIIFMIFGILTSKELNELFRFTDEPLCGETGGLITRWSKPKNRNHAFNNH